MKEPSTDSSSIFVKVRTREFMVPPIRDCLVIGKKAPIGFVALKKALSLLHGAPFERLQPESDVISDILVRAAVLRKIPREKLIALVLARVAPLMADDELAQLDIEVEVVLEEQL